MTTKIRLAFLLMSLLGTVAFSQEDLNQQGEYAKQRDYSSQIVGFPSRRLGSHSLPISSVQWKPTSFWGQRFDAMNRGVAQTMTPIMLGQDRSHFLANFEIAASLSDGRHRGAAWNDGDCYKWIEALSAFYSQTRDPKLLELLEMSTKVIELAQRSDGYIHTPVLIAARNLDESNKSLGDPANFEMYNMGHLMTAACVHYEATQQRRLLDVAIRAADYLDLRFAKPDASIARHAICPAHYMGAIDLYRTTGDRKYLELCKRWMQMRDLVQGGGDDNQDRIPFLQQRQAVGHAVRANYLYAGAADLFLETRQQELLEPLLACWQSVQQRKIYITGGCGALYDGASPDGSDKQSTITRIHQAYGRDFQLPNSTAHNETCAAIGNVLWNQRMWWITREAKYVDALENSLYNAVLAGVSLDGQRYFYTNTLRQLNEMPTKLRWSRQREAWISCYCCPPNVARTVAQVNRMAYSVDQNSTNVLLFGSNRLTQTIEGDSMIELEQTSDYPMSGSVLVKVVQAPSKPYAIGFRIPGWCSKATIKVNEEIQELKLTPASIVSLTRTWKASDTIDLQLEMPVELLEAHPLVEECRGQVAVRRGPLIYCLESTDLPNLSSIHRVAIDASSVGSWKVEMASDDVLAGVPLITAELLVHSDAAPEANSQVDKDSVALYRPLTSKSYRTYSASLVPYYAWGNRGNSEMSVWIPTKP